MTENELAAPPINIRTNAYVVYDAKADAYEWPFPARTDGKAKQFIISRAMDTSNPLHNFAADFTLYYRGYIMDNTSEIVEEPLRSLGTVLQLITQYTDTETE